MVTKSTSKAMLTKAVLLFASSSSCWWCPFTLALAPVVPSVKNFRPVLSGSADEPVSTIFFRSATLDDLSLEDAQGLLDGSMLGAPLAAVIDLRNQDEVKRDKRSEGANVFYNALQLENDDDKNENASIKTECRLISIPILKDINAFWDEAIDRLDPATKMKATLQTAFQGGALDRAAARNLEAQGLSLLYTIMLATSQSLLKEALEACIAESERGPVLFHCQKGKDRTGVLAMLLQSCCFTMMMDDDESSCKEVILKEYSVSGELLGGKEVKGSSSVSSSKNKSSSMTIDWSYFRGSPEFAMNDTMEWIEKRYGSIESYLDAIGFDEKKRQALRNAAVKM